MSARARRAVDEARRSRPKNAEVTPIKILDADGAIVASPTSAEQEEKGKNT